MTQRKRVNPLNDNRAPNEISDGLSAAQTAARGTKPLAVLCRHEGARSAWQMR